MAHTTIGIEQLQEEATRIRDALRQEIVRLFGEVKGLPGMNESRAAEALGIKRQTFNVYLKGETTPSADVLLNACRLWGLEFRVRDPRGSGEDPKWLNLAVRSSGRKIGAPKTAPQQLSLALDELKDDDVEVRIVERKGGKLELLVDIQFSKHIA